MGYLKTPPAAAGGAFFKTVISLLTLCFFALQAFPARLCSLERRSRGGTYRPIRLPDERPTDERHGQPTGGTYVNRRAQLL